MFSIPAEPLNLQVSGVIFCLETIVLPTLVLKEEAVCQLFEVQTSPCDAECTCEHHRWGNYESSETSLVYLSKHLFCFVLSSRFLFTYFSCNLPSFTLSLSVSPPPKYSNLSSRDTT